LVNVKHAVHKLGVLREGSVLPIGDGEKAVLSCYILHACALAVDPAFETIDCGSRCVVNDVERVSELGTAADVHEACVTGCCVGLGVDLYLHLAVLLLLGTGAGGVPEIESAGVEPVILSWYGVKRILCGWRCCRGGGGSGSRDWNRGSGIDGCS